MSNKFRKPRTLAQLKSDPRTSMRSILDIYSHLFGVFSASVTTIALMIVKFEHGHYVGGVISAILGSIVTARMMFLAGTETIEQIKIIFKADKDA